MNVLHDPLWNKGMSFSLEERDRLGIRGLIPPTISTIESQIERNMKSIKKLPNDVERNIHLQNLHNRNETLYHRLLVEHMEEVAPLVYTPTVGQVCLNFGHQFRRSRFILVYQTALPQQGSIGECISVETIVACLDQW
jgi:malate dehydrogenase (oxaloacetate-decarboxylating)(NADP+)